MIETIPNVLAVLREGLTRMQWPSERIQQFFGRLMNSHASAVKRWSSRMARRPKSRQAPSGSSWTASYPTDTSDVALDQIRYRTTWSGTRLRSVRPA